MWAQWDVGGGNTCQPSNSWGGGFSEELLLPAPGFQLQVEAGPAHQAQRDPQALALLPM